MLPDSIIKNLLGSPGLSGKGHDCIESNGSKLHILEETGMILARFLVQVRWCNQCFVTAPACELALDHDDIEPGSAPPS